MTRIIVAGASGRMGSRIIALLKEYPDLKLTGAFEKKGHEAVGKDIGLIAGIGETGVRLSDRLEDIIENGDVIIDFTTTSSTKGNVKLSSTYRKAMIIGTTGFSKDDLKEIEASIKSIPCVMASNMSTGVNLLLRVLQDVAKVLGDEYDIEIIEAHHRLKKDAPSGTALKMAQVLADATSRSLDEVAVYARKGIIGDRKSVV